MTPEREILRRLVELKDRRARLESELSVLPLVGSALVIEELRACKRDMNQAWVEAAELLAQPERKLPEAPTC